MTAPLPPDLAAVIRIRIAYLRDTRSSARLVRPDLPPEPTVAPVAAGPPVAPAE
jgi:hypothetical protein